MLCTFTNSQTNNQLIFAIIKRIIPYKRTMSTSQDPVKESVPDPSPIITEGKAKMLFPKDVFYNPVQVLNRDLSIAVINEYAKNFWRPAGFRQKRPFWISNQSTSETPPTETPPTSHKPDNTPTGLTILEPLGASGLRSIRYALEVSPVDRIICNDISQEAFQSMIANINRNGVDNIVIPSCKDASMLMYEHRDPFKQCDVIDIDPYGTPIDFLDSAVQSCQNGGLLCVTCTDTRVLCGYNIEKCYSKYGSVPLKTRYSHEMALRIVLSSLNSFANRYGRYIHPLMSVSLDFYCRLFVTVYTSPVDVKRSVCKQSLVYHCNNCSSFHLQPFGQQQSKRSQKSEVTYSPSWGPPVNRDCEHCGSSFKTFKLGGPVWSDPIHDVHFVKSLMKSIGDNKERYSYSERMIGLLSMLTEELPDVPFFHVVDDLCSTVHSNCIKLSLLKSAILNQGYRVSLSHTEPRAIKTNAPHNVIWDIIREWVKINPPVKDIDQSSVAGRILSKESSTEVSFSLRTDANPPSRHKLVRFPENPEPNWGPKPRAKKRTNNESEDEISLALKKDKTEECENN